MRWLASIAAAASIFLLTSAALAQPVPGGTVDTNGDGVGDLGTWVGPCYFGTSDGTPTDDQLVACEYAASIAGGGNVFVIGTHGGIGTAQCLPPNGTVGASGASQVMCSICYAGSQDPFGNSIAECVVGAGSLRRFLRI
ncbi:MAG: hypothetical protein ETSY1_17640 [Candidatus Entotheonella factor]|uniref:Uncharacterized protein n=1 Tax=Entotheonella factor TaxID=1429438 RepID=W4LKT0_ENTF1|nr:MAG: hypothetical protein ETSY1_17640 [Candidatus Entotheonella factor]